MPIGQDIDGLNLVFRQTFMQMKAQADEKIASSPSMSEQEKSFLILGAIREAVVQTILANNEEIELQLQSWRLAPTQAAATIPSPDDPIPY